MANSTTLLHHFSSNIQHNSKIGQEFCIFKTQTEPTQKDKDEILLALLKQNIVKINSEYNSYSGFQCTDFSLADLLAL